MEAKEKTRHKSVVIPKRICMLPASLNDIINDTKSATKETMERTMLITENGDIFLSVNL